MAKFIVTIEVEFDPEAAARDGFKIKAPRKWNVLQKSYALTRWRNYTRNTTILSITDPILTPEEEKGMQEGWELANHNLD